MIKEHRIIFPALLLLATIFHGTFSQPVWVTQNPLPQCNTLNDVEFIGASTGYEAGNYGTILKTTDGGSSWISQSSGTTENLNSVSFLNAATGFIAGGQNAWVILKTTNRGAITNIQTINNNIPAGYSLSQNYPNPFNPVTVIKYQIPKANYVSIKLYDQLGRELGILYEGDQQAGYYQATVDGTNLASGVYFCRITIAGYNKVIKMSLIK